MQRKTIVIVVTSLVVVLSFFLASQSASIRSLVTPNTAPTPMPTESPDRPGTSITVFPSGTPAPVRKMQVKIFLVSLEDGGKVGCGDSLVPVTREIPQTQGVLKASLTDLFSIKEQYYGESGLYNALYNSNLSVRDAVINNGIATINLQGQVSLGGVCDNPRLEAQIRSTAEQFSTVKDVKIFLNGRPLADALSEK